MSDQKCFTVTWAIENFSIYSSTDFLELKSPSWCTETTDGYGGPFNLKLHVTSLEVIFQLHNAMVGTHKSCEMSLISSCGTILLKRKGSSSIFSFNRDYKFGDKKHSVLLNGTLVVCCKILEVCKNKRELRFCSVLYRMNFPWTIENFDYHDDAYHNISRKKDILLLHSKIVRNETFSSSSHTFTVRIEPERDDLDVYILDFRFSSKKDCGFNAFKAYHIPDYNLWKTDIHIFKACNTDKDLRLQFECIVAVNMNNHTSTVHSNNIKTLTAYPTSEGVNAQTVCSTSESAKTKAPSIAVQDSPGTLTSDLLSLLRDTTLSDATLNTEGKSFSAHKNILAARSSVFKAMFEKEETTEGRSGVVDIEDVDTETVQRLLFFLYGESLEDLQWDDASKLYYAADKYAVLLLKKKCANILKAGLSVSNVCDAIVLADMHSDDELMKGAVDFVRDHQEVISGSDWENLEKSHSQLAAKILRQVFVEKAKN